MSVTTLGLEVYKEVFKKACSYRYRSVVDINYCWSLKMNEENVRKWVYQLYEMVELSYCAHYKRKRDKEDLDWTRNVISQWRYNDFKGTSCNTYQMLKHLNCIHYQIEPYEMVLKNMWNNEHDKAHKLLNDAIVELLNLIVAQIPEYKEAKWGEV